MHQTNKKIFIMLLQFTDLKPQHQSSVIGQILEAKSQIVYMEANTLPFLDQMEAWESKEYSSIYSDLKKQIADLKSYISENQSHFNLLLNQYSSGLCVPLFMNLNINMIYKH